ncbi:MAG TPA: tetratricopeptide repeat protein [Chloroflexota bacterium]
MLSRAVGTPRGRGARAQDFARSVRDGLRHLHDPVYLETHALARFVGRAGAGTGQRHVGEALQRLLGEAIESLRPPPGVDDPTAQRRYEVLFLRYVEGLRTPEVQDRLAVSHTTLYREHERAVEALVSRLRTEWAIDATAPAGPAALPVPLTRLVGRDREAAALGTLLLDPAVRVLTLTGPGGVGKTRLALRIAAEATSAFPDGVFFVPLASVGDTALVLPTVAGALRSGGAVGAARPAGETLREHLAGRRALLVLDNLEHLIGVGPELAASVGPHPGVKLLATSRAPLRVYGEQEFPVRPLSVPHPTAPLDSRAAAASDAVRLFVERARAVDPGFALSDQNVAAVVEVCRRLDGLPLALELAAARVRLFSPQAMRERLGSLLPLLSGGPLDAPTRHRAMGAAIAWSYELLDEPHRRLFRRLAVFAGGCGLEAAEVVCGGEDGPDVLSGVEALMAQSLLQRADPPSEGDPGPRVTMLSTVREWGWEQLAASGDDGPTEARHAAYYLRMAEEAAAEDEAGRATGWLARLEPERDNLRAALRWYVERREAEPGLRLGAALERFWYLTARLVEGRAWLAELLRLDGAANAPSRARALAAAGWLADLDADPDAARALCLDAVAIGRSGADVGALAHALLGLGLAEARQGRLGVAGPHLDEALALYRRLGNRRGVEFSLLAQGSTALREGDRAAARGAFEAILATALPAGDEQRIALAHEWLGNVAYEEGRLAEARAHYERALALRREAGDPWIVAHALQGLALIALAEGDDADARGRLRRCLRMQREMRDTAWLAATLDCAAILVARRAAGSADADGASLALELAGAAETLRRGVDEILAPGARARLDRWLAAARGLWPEAQAAAAEARGRALGVERATALALERLGENGSAAEG